MRHILDLAERHFEWDRHLPAALVVESGDEIVLAVGDPQPPPTERLASRQPTMPLSGPIAVRGAEPGDTLQIDVIEIWLGARGYTRVEPGVGLLSDAVTEVYRHEWLLEGKDQAEFKPGISIPIRPFLGLIGVAPDSEMPLSALPPGLHGGNLDIKHLTIGSTLWLPILVAGANLSAGDMHAAQGDGEVGGTAIETWGAATLRLTLRQDLQLRAPQFRSAGALEAEEYRKPWHGTVGVGPDLMEASRDALRDMLAFMRAEFALSGPEAYALASVVVDLRIAEIVDHPNWVVTACLPLGIFGQD